MILLIVTIIIIVMMMIIVIGEAVRPERADPRHEPADAKTSTAPQNIITQLSQL